jgi:hypothetical protein
MPVPALETCTTKTMCMRGIAGSGAGQLFYPAGVAVDGSGHLFVADSVLWRVEEFSSSGKFIRAWGGVGTGAGQLDAPHGIAVDGSGDVFVADPGEERVDEFSSAGPQVSFTRAWGWGVIDGQSQFEDCTTTCRLGLAVGGAGQLSGAAGVAVDGLGDVFVINGYNNRVDEFSSVGAEVSFTRAWGWGVLDRMPHFETCTTTTGCKTGLEGGGSGQLGGPDSGPYPAGVAIDGWGDVFVADNGNDRVDEFSSVSAKSPSLGPGDGASPTATSNLRRAPPPACLVAVAPAPVRSTGPTPSQSTARATCSPSTPTTHGWTSLA